VDAAGEKKMEKGESGQGKGSLGFSFSSLGEGWGGGLRTGWLRRGGRGEGLLKVLGQQPPQEICASLSREKEGKWSGPLPLEAIGGQCSDIGRKDKRAPADSKGWFGLWGPRPKSHEDRLVGRMQLKKGGGIWGGTETYWGSRD